MYRALVSNATPHAESWVLVTRTGSTYLEDSTFGNFGNCVTGSNSFSMSFLHAAGSYAPSQTTVFVVNGISWPSAEPVSPDPPLLKGVWHVQRQNFGHVLLPKNVGVLCFETLKLVQEI